MRFLIAPAFYDELHARTDHTPDCYVRPGEYLHHLYVDGVKYIVVRALTESLAKAREAGDAAALHHLELHQHHLDMLGGQAAIDSGLAEGADLLGDPPPPLDDGPDTSPL